MDATIDEPNRDVIVEIAKLQRRKESRYAGGSSRDLPDVDIAMPDRLSVVIIPPSTGAGITSGGLAPLVAVMWFRKNAIERCTRSGSVGRGGM